MTEELRHYSDTPVVFDWEREYEQGTGHGGLGKPHGLWVSVVGDDSWEEWCRGEGFGLDRLAVVHRVTLTEDAHLLHISTGEALDAFHREYSCEREGWDYRSGNTEFDFNQRPLDWALVAKEYDGILIAPYIWSHRMRGPMWYYGFDCASGCIWNPQAIASVTVDNPTP